MRSITEADIPTIKLWYAARGLEIDAGMLPKLGLIIDDVCACFLYISLEKCAMIEGLVSNPMANPKVAYVGIHKVIDGLTKLAEDFGAKYTIAIIKSESVVKIGKKLGYKDHGMFKVLVKGL